MNKRIELLQDLQRRINKQIESFMYGNQDLGDLMYTIGQDLESFGYDIKHQEGENDRAWEDEISPEEMEVLRSIYTGEEL